MRIVRMYNPTHRFDDNSLAGPATTDPTVNWSQRLQSQVTEVAAWDDTIYCTTRMDGSQGGAIVALELGGTPRWRSQTSGRILSSPAVASGVVYVGASDNHVYALSVSEIDTEVSQLGSTQPRESSIYAACSNCGTDLSEYESPAFCPGRGLQEPLFVLPL